MNLRSLLALTFFLAASSTVALAGPCATNTLAFYRDTHFDGNACSNGNLFFFNFVFAQISGPANVNANSIVVSPSTAGIGLDFSGTTESIFNRVVTEREQYYISYTVDPPPVVAGDDLYLDPPTGPIVVSRWTCPDDVFNQSVGFMSLSGLATASYSTTFQCLNRGEGSAPFFIQATSGSEDALRDSVTYPNLASSVTVRMVIDLFPGVHTGLEAIQATQQVVPEPAAFLPLAAGVAGLVAFVRRRRKMVKS